MNTVFIVKHSYEKGPCDETKMIGVYSSQLEAEHAVARLSLQPGFNEKPECFFISEYELNKDHWTEGYVTV
jgi:hypothetical protein